MKIALTIVYILLQLSVCFAQSSAFVLVDVSGSGPSKKTARQEAENIAKDIINGEFKNSDYTANWKWIGGANSFVDQLTAGKNVRPLVDVAKNGLLMIMPFGEKNTYQNFKVGEPKKIPADVNQFFSANYPTVYNQAFTYQSIAIAAAASVAKNQNIDDYFMILVSDHISDPKTGYPPGYTQKEEEMLAAWGTANTLNRKLGTLKYTGDNSNYQIVFSRVSGINKISTPVTLVGSQNVDKKELRIIRPTGVSRTKPESSSSNQIPVMWSCLGCDSTAQFSVRLNYLGSEKGVSSQSRQTADNSVKFRVDTDGLYKVTLSGEGLTRNGYVIVKGGSSRSADSADGGCGAFPAVLFFLLLVGGGFYLYRRNNKYNTTPQQEESQNLGSRRTPPTDNKNDNSSEEDLW